MDSIKDFVRENIVDHHISSFNYFISNGIQEILNREQSVAGITFGAVHVDKPSFNDMNRVEKPMLPNHARKQNITYEGVVRVNIVYNGKETQRVPIGKIPIMLRSAVCNLTRTNMVESEECSNDPGGYFIIKGKERVLVGQLRPCYNRVYTHACKPLEKYSYYSEIRSMNESGVSVLVKALIDNKNACFLSLPYIKTTLPAGYVFRALDIELENVLKWCRCKDRLFVAAMTEQYNQFSTSEDVIEEIANRLPSVCEGDPKEYIRTILSKELFYHLGMLTAEKSARHIAYILKRLVSVATGSLEVDDVHNLSNKRLDTSGNLVAFIFNGLFKQFVKTLSTQMSNKISNGTIDPISIIKSINTITYGMSSCFMSSNWTTQKTSNAYSREGVSQVLSVQNYGAKLSHLRRLMLPNGVKGKNTAARLLHSSHFSFLCPYETPEGERVGLVTNLALTTNISIPIASHEIVESGIFETTANETDGRFLVLLNGKIMGTCDDALAFKRKFNDYRSKHVIDEKVSMVWQRYADEIHVWSDEGRMYRPLYSVRADNTVDNSRFVFRDVQELEQAVVAMDTNDLKRNKCEYMEICPAASMMSIMASVIPLADHSQSPRNAYQASMGKQAIGIPSEAFRYRYDTTLHVLNYPQQPITKSKMVNVIKFNEMSHGSVPIVAIMTFNGFNQEDSLILNKSSLERGLFSAMTYSTIVEEEKKKGNTDFETICLPKLQYRRHDVNYSHLGDDGVVKNKSVYLKAGDAIVGKTQNKTVKKDGIRQLETTDITVVIKPGEEGFIDSVIDLVNSDGARIIKIRMRKLRFPEIGDKFASSCAQKGTCGMIYAQEDMPFDKNGVHPDVIINPHAIPSRMTINMLIEQTLNLVGCKVGKFQDATTFEHPNITEELSAKLKEAGFTDYNGDGYKSVLYSGTTGEKYKTRIFMAPAFYQRLKHLVSDKIHARMYGPVDTLTRIPIAGRSHGGGLRLGAMEIDATIASGCSNMIRDLMYEQSDKYVMPVCDRCGQVPLKPDYCQICDDGMVTKKITPYATKLFYQLLQGHGMKIKIN